MSRKATCSGHEYLLSRKNPRTGFTERIIYTGSLSQKPKGWTLLKAL